LALFFGMIMGLSSGSPPDNPRLASAFMVKPIEIG